MKCELCEGEKPIEVRHDVEAIVRNIPFFDVGWTIAIWHKLNPRLEDYLDFPVKYCPMCGRKLEEGT